VVNIDNGYGAAVLARRLAVSRDRRPGGRSGSAGAVSDTSSTGAVERGR
jgi:hypothetical protein